MTTIRTKPIRSSKASYRRYQRNLMRKRRAAAKAEALSKVDWDDALAFAMLHALAKPPRPGERDLALRKRLDKAITASLLAAFDAPDAPDPEIDPVKARRRIVAAVWKGIRLTARRPVG
jgi:hypothetical protein